MERGGYPGAPQEDIGLLLWSEQRAKEVRASCGLLRDLNALLKNTRSEAATALIFRSADMLSVDFNLQSDEVGGLDAGHRIQDTEYRIQDTGYVTAVFILCRGPRCAP